MRILYLGLPLGALALDRAGVRLSVVCVGSMDSLGMRRLRACMAQNKTLVLAKPNLNDRGIQNFLTTVRPDAILSWFWPRRIPQEVLRLPRVGAYGTHPSLLPRWRGPDPYFWAIRSGDHETGVSLHRIEEEYDTGEVIEQRTISILPSDNSWTLARKLDRPALELLVECARRLMLGVPIQGTAQVSALATHAPSPSDIDLEIDWKMSADEVVRLVRAASPWPGAQAQLGEHAVEVVRASIARESPPSALVTADAWRTSDGWAVRCGRGAVLLERVRMEDDTDAHLDVLLNDHCT